MTRLIGLVCGAIALAMGSDVLVDFRTAAQETPPALEATAKDAEQAGRLKEAFDLYVRAVQALPDPPSLDVDIRLRERLVALATRLDPKPVMPGDADRFTVRGQVLFKDATDEAGFDEAAGEFRKAVRAAPWAATLAYNLALVQEKQQFYKSASANLKVYLLANPPDAEAVRAKMYEFELRREKNKDLAEKEDCAYGDAATCRAVESRRMGVGSSFSVMHQHNPLFGDTQFATGQLTILGDGLEFTESASGNPSHGFKAACVDIKQIVGSPSRSGTHLFILTDIARLPGFWAGVDSFRMGDVTTPLEEERSRQAAVLAGIRYVCPNVKQ